MEPEPGDGEVGQPGPPPPPPHHLVTDRLLNKLEKEQQTNNVDVQIGTGMDIGIIGENGMVY